MNEPDPSREAVPGPAPSREAVPDSAPSRETRFVHAASDPRRQGGYVNPPVHRASTVLYQDTAEMDASQADPLKRGPQVYGRFGTPTGRAFEEALTELEGGHAAVATCSGLAAITTVILAYVRAGDHILVSDSVYLPTRKFCDSLAVLGVETEYYDPAAGGAAIEELIRPTTRLLYLESPGSTTFEVQDVPALTAVCRARGVATVADNTWATPAFCRPMALGAGVDAVVHSATKYLTGHADSILGAIVCTRESYPVIRGAAIRLGQCASADDVYLGLRGLRTLGVRMSWHQDQGLELARWTAKQEGVAAVLHPGLPEDPGHGLWRRDFTGAAGLFGVELEPRFGKPDVDAMLDRLRVFGLGHSYGGYESLVVPADPVSHRLPGTWAGRGPLIRVHVGFEGLDDLKQDLTAGFETLLDGGGPTP
ncbi:cystathionine beta-lyase [Streptomyces antarcticus]|uniref:cystathionine beta-lyase n=1 Tax=Streptomyces antarcticus TaxID=2996458 RepID=UPI00226F2B56|nr:MULTISPECIES: cystathionine beta-lyase [unclassified Streptomyces]MCY0946645.1 cystathionine beta-lyase [Streptomyces sp. H34-AA3]MCZ4085663.1 cystathionine beta-lyase [Streptomyces sp. H34-S5]